MSVTARTSASYAGLLKRETERRAELGRMRVFASALLVLMTCLFLAVRRAPPDWALAPYVRAFAESGMVGACADWFAVVAIFRRPLGLPIPHTAVSPENKKRLGAALGRFIAANFLSPRAALTRLHDIDAVAIAARWLRDERNARALAAGAGRLALASLPRETLEQWATLVARKGLEAVPLAPLASRALAVLWAEGAGQLVLDQALEFFESALRRNKRRIVHKVRQQSSGGCRSLSTT